MVLGNSAGAADGESMVNEEREHLGNLPVNVFPIPARKADSDEVDTTLHLLIKMERKEIIVALVKITLSTS